VAPHFEHVTVGCAVGVVDSGLIEVGIAEAFAPVRGAVDLSARAEGGRATRTFAVGPATSGTAGCADVPFAGGAFFGIPPPFPGGEFSAMSNFSGGGLAVAALRNNLRSQRYPVRAYRLFHERNDCGSLAFAEASAVYVFARHRKHYRFGTLRFARQRRNQRNEECDQKQTGERFANDAAAITIPEKPKSPDKIAADKNSRDQCCIVFRMAFAQRNRRVLRLVTTAITTKDVNNMAVAAKVRLAISMSYSRANFLVQHKFQSALGNAQRAS